MPADEEEEFDDYGQADADEALVIQLSHAWRVWFRSAKEPTGLLGQLLDIARRTPQGKAGRPADAVGVSASTWNRWIAGARRMPGGTTPSNASRAKIRAAVRSSRVRPDRPTPTTVVIRAVVVWNRYQNGSKVPLSAGQRPDMTKIRTVRLTDLTLDAARAAWEVADDHGSAQALLDEVGEVYGVPVEFWEAESITLEE